MRTVLRCRCQFCYNYFDVRAAEKRRGWGKYCSLSCSASKRNKVRPKKRSPIKRVRTRCRQCGIYFDARLADAKRGRATYCSLSCGASWQRDETRRKIGLNVTCAACGKKFYRKPSKVGKSKSGLEFCSRGCKQKAQSIYGLGLIILDHWRDGRHSYRDIAFRNHPNRCSRCGFSDHIGILEVHHIDHDRLNNIPENLEILCPTCHKTDHYIDRGIIKLKVG